MWNSDLLFQFFFWLWVNTVECEGVKHPDGPSMLFTTHTALLHSSRVTGKEMGHKYDFRQ